MKPIGTRMSGDKLLSRRDYLQVLDAAIQAGSFRFARQAALSWLATFPGDLWVNCYLGKAQLGEGRTAQATAIFEKLCALDPEFLDARLGLLQCYRAQGNKQLENLLGCVYALGGELEAGQVIPEWGKQLRLARQAMMQGSQELADRSIQQVIAMTPDLALVAVTHIRLTSLEGQPEACHQLANVYHTRWPDCLQFGLYLAEGEVAFGDEAKAVSLLHQCVSGDSAGQVASRLWGSDHRYRPLWPETLEVYFDLPIPAPVAAQLGRNQLATGDIIIPPARPAVSPDQTRPGSGVGLSGSVGADADKSEEKKYISHVSPETVQSVEETFERLAKRMKRPSLGRADGRYPLYVLLSTRKGLEQQYGPQTREVIENLMKNIGDLIAKHPGWGSMVFLPDEATNMSKLGLKPVDTLDPWKIKLALTDLDGALAKKGQMIGSVLIVGGPEVVPYHKLPNPTDDADKDVPSDNPYTTLDSNYFVPEWPLGRISGGSGTDAGLLLEQLRGIIRYHGKSAKTMPTLATIITWLLEFLKSRSISRKDPGFGYTAEVWKQSSTEVFKVLSEKGSLISSPPEQSSSVSGEQIAATPLGYFNLHGIEDGPNWYGQRDSASNLSGPDYPIALSPTNLTKNGHAPQVIYTEACYGANIIDKKEDESLALKFMLIGTNSFVGSTVISYGSVGSPLIGADLLGSFFWRHMKEGLTVGESLMQAKIELVKEMTQRQGFLDGEDQKTLISFVLYGDPLAGYDTNAAHSKGVTRARNRAEVKTICDRQVSEQGMQPVSAKVLNQVKAAVAGYLPGVEEPEVVVSLQHESCDGTRHSCPTSEIGSRTVTTAKSNGVVVTVSKKIIESQHIHLKYARVTLNSRGKVVKLAVSR